jgi:hypothetical protein
MGISYFFFGIDSQTAKCIHNLAIDCHQAIQSEAENFL